ncbi:MAG TPA: LLM class flavin-dependent oxidoreductase, partial [Actinomycetota bacterium]
DCLLLPRGPRPQGPPIMIGTTGPRMLRLAAAHADGWNAWFSWYGNTAEGVAALREKVDQACAAEGRDPATLDRTVAVLVQVGEGELLRRSGRYETPPPLRGSAEEMAAALRRFASEGISHVQLVVDPITIESIESLAGMLEALDR